MKKIVLIMAMFIACVTFAKADNDKPITVHDLPASSQSFIKQHFGDKKVALAKKETDLFVQSYDVMFTDGSKLEFDRKGEWTEINCKYSSVPEVVIPKQIIDFINRDYPEAKVLKIERDSREYEVKLSNKVELKFDIQFRLLDIDLD